MKQLYTSIFLLVLLSLRCFAQPCTTAPLHTVFVSSPSVCPNYTVGANAGTSSTVTGLTYQWYTSTTSPVGPFTVVPSATLQTYNSAPLNTTTWFMSVVTCTNTQNTLAVTGTVTVPGPTISTLPYLEDFSGINVTNELPNCSWSVPALGSTALTFTSPAKMAAFSYSPAGTSYFYTSKMWLNAGVTYSTGLSYRNDVNGQTNWSNLAILVGPSQSTTGLVQVANSNGPFTSTVLSSLSNTFAVNTSTFYHVAVRGTGTTSGSSQYLYWDDLFVFAPCQLNPFIMNLSTGNTTICAGSQVNLNVNGAHTYTWNTGAHSAVITDVPMTSTVYAVTGVDTLSGCAQTLTVAVQVDPTPTVYVFGSPLQTCPGNPVTLNAIGGVQYFWSSGASGPSTIVTPSTTTIYSVMVMNAQNCTAVGSILVSVMPSPVITATTTSYDVCDDGGKTVTLTATGGIVYSWSSSSFYIQANPAIVSPKSSITITVTGTAANGCSGKVTMNLIAHPAPTVTAFPINTLVCLGGSVVFQAAGAANYSWSNGSSGSQIIVQPSAPTATTYVVTGTNAEGCTSSAIVALLAYPCTDLAEKTSGKSLRIFPNPSADYFHIDGAEALNSPVITDITGAAVYFIITADHDLVLPDAAPGVYFFRFADESGAHVVKLIKQ